MRHGRFPKWIRLGAGFTLIEALIVIVIAGALSVVAVRFVQRPVEQYLDQTRRAELTNIADSAVRRMSRDIHLALPNSVRSPNNTCVEFIPTYDGGRYRAALTSGSTGNAMQNDVAITQLDVIGNLNSLPATINGDQLVIYNLGIENLDAYAGDNRTAVSGFAGGVLSFAAKQFKISSPDNRFQLVSRDEEAVSFVCTNVGVDAGGNGTGTLYRVSHYGFVSPAPAACQNVAAGSPSISAILATQVSRCEFSYAPGVVERSAIVSVRLNVARSGETVSLYHDVNVNNVP
ncbi:MAG: type II secretion system protein [Burkholderiales bacterium]|nr:type II secretion system protein [Burkholderiales bacterium]